MPAAQRALRVVASMLVVFGAGMLGWYLIAGSSTAVSDAQAVVDPSPNSSAETAAEPETPTAVEAAIATPVPTPTPPPTATPVPTPMPFEAAVPIGPLEADLASPLACDLLGSPERIAGTITLACIDDDGPLDVIASASGRVVHINRSAAVEVDAPHASAGDWSWARQGALGPHVVIDHGRVGPSANVQTVYAGLADIDEALAIGELVSEGQALGSVVAADDRSARLLYSVWADNARQDGTEYPSGPPAFDVQLEAAEALGAVIESPTDPGCPLALGASQLPGASRDYRNGTHRGIDFGCGAAGRFGAAIADGTVVYVVDDYKDPTVPHREQLLAAASIAGFTPHWTLMMLYGNVVIIDHGEIPGAGRVVTISAHLESVDPAVRLGAEVKQGDRIGEFGNRGTNASALGIRGAADSSLHLHWELYIDNWYLGAGMQTAQTAELIQTALCGNAATSGCPA